jgi:hypothetical protein
MSAEGTERRTWRQAVPLAGIIDRGKQREPAAVNIATWRS